MGGVGTFGYFLFFLVAFLTLTILLIWPVFPYVVLAILLAYLFYPLNLRLQKRIRSAGVRAGLLTLLAVVAIALPLVYGVQKVTRELGSAIQLRQATQLLEKARLWLIDHQAESVADWMIEAVERGREFVLDSAPNLFGSVFQVILGIFVCLFVFYYFTKEGAGIWNTFLKALPLPDQLKWELSREVTGILRAIFFGQLLTALVQGSVGGIGLVICQVPQPFLLTALMVLLAFLPFVGATMVWAPAGLLKLMAGQTEQGLILLIYGFVVVMNIDNLVRPRLIALHSQVHPVVILIGIIGGIQVFGFIGFLVGPVIFAIFLQMLKFFAESRAAENAAATQPPGVPLGVESVRE
ncbi:MAG: AI-2E family transporter [Acidobacteria bacterium]|nr:AI-2E family transporter [Acidobacteriota bacterium]